MSSLYREKILEHYKHPHNQGSIEEPDMEAEVSNPTCGDDLTFQAAVKNGEITDIKFDGEGCALSIAAASMLTDEVKGEDVATVKNISDERLFTLLGLEKDAVSPMRMKCVLLSRDGVQQMVNTE